MENMAVTYRAEVLGVATVKAEDMQGMALAISSPCTLVEGENLHIKRRYKLF